jgi:hypothetical protein
MCEEACQCKEKLCIKEGVGTLEEEAKRKCLRSSFYKEGSPHRF